MAYVVTKENVNVNTGVIELVVPPVNLLNSKRHQITIDSSASAGSWTVEAMYIGSTRYIALSPIASVTASGTDAYKPILLDCAAVKQWRITPVGITAGTLYSVTIIGADS